MMSDHEVNFFKGARNRLFFVKLGCKTKTHVQYEWERAMSSILMVENSGHETIKNES